MISWEQIKNAVVGFFPAVWECIKKFCLWIYKKLVKVSMWQRVLYVLAALFFAMMVVSVVRLIMYGTLASLLSCISFGALLFIDILIMVLFYYDLKSKKGLELYIDEFNEVNRKFSRLTEKSELNIPWFLVLGEKGSGKSDFIENSGVHFFQPKKRASSKISTFFNKTVLFWKYDIDSDEENVNDAEPEDPDVDLEDNEVAEKTKKKDSGNNDFDVFLQFLKTRKNLFNLNGIVLTVSAEELINNDKEYLVKIGRKYSELINYIQHTVGICLPLYLTVTKSDKICGFNEFLKKLDPKYYNQVFGWTNRFSTMGEKFSSVEFLEQIDFIIETAKKQRLNYMHRFISESEKTNYYDTAAYFSFTENIKGIADNIVTLTEAIALGVYTNSKLQEKKYNLVPLYVRGIYFTSSIPDTCFFDKVFFNEMHETTELKRVSGFTDHLSSFFIKELFENIFSKDYDVSMRITSLRRSYRWKRIFGIGMIFATFAFLIVFTTIYWINVYRYITFDKSKLETAEKISLRSDLFYPEKDVDTVNARNNYMILNQDMAFIVNNIEKANSSVIESSTMQPISIPYTALDNFDVDKKFDPEYFVKISEQWKKIEKMVEHKVDVIHLDYLKSTFYNAKSNYFAYLDQYFMYWRQILTEASKPQLISWEKLKTQRYQYWQVANSYRKSANIIKNALVTFKENTKGELTQERGADLENLLKSLKGMDASIANTLVQNKAVNMISFWNKVFVEKETLASREIIFNTDDAVLYQNGIFKYTQKGEYWDYYEEYWEKLSLMFLNSLRDAVTVEAQDFISKVENVNRFPVKVVWQENNGMSVKELEDLNSKLYSYWPVDSSYPKGTVGNGKINIDPIFEEAISELRPQLKAGIMDKVNGLKKLIKDMLPVNGKNHKVKVYLMPPDDNQQDNVASDFWTIMRMSQEKSVEKNTSIRTRTDNAEYLGELLYPGTGTIKFDFFRTVDTLKGYNPNITLNVNGIWGALRLIFDGPERPQAYKGEYWITWKAVKQVDNNTWISKLSFVKDSGDVISFYIKLVYSSDVNDLNKMR